MESFINKMMCDDAPSCREFDTLIVGDVLYDIEYHVDGLHSLEGPFRIIALLRASSDDMSCIDVKDVITGEVWSLWFDTIKAYKNKSDDMKYAKIVELHDV